jgi:hypothetical protein
MPAGPRSPASWPTAFGAWLLGAALALPFAFEAIAEPDAGWSLAIGRSLATTGLPRTNLLTWTARDHAWYPTAWLFDLALFRAHALLGPLGLQLLTAALVALMLLGLAVASRELHPRGPWIVPAVALLFVPRILPRPHLVSWAAEAWVFALCLLAERRGVRWRVACVPLIAVASNFHAGAVFPWIVLAAFCVERAWAERAWLREGALAVVGGLALFANPGALFNLRDNLAHLQVDTRLPNHEEFLHGWPWRVPAFYVVAIVAIGAAFTQRRASPIFLPLVLLFAGLGVFAVRFSTEFPLIAAPVIAGGFTTMGRARWGLLALLATLGVSTLVGRIGRWTPVAGWDEHALPVRAAAFARGEQLSGRLFNAFEDGGYLEYALPEVPAFQDGRVMAFPATFFLDELAAERSPAAFQRYLRTLGVEWAITPTGQCGLCGAGLLSSPDWALVYWDDTTEVRLRRDVPHFAAALARLEFHHLLPRAPPTALVQLAHMLPNDEATAYAAEADRFARAMPKSPFAPLLRCATLSRLHDAGAASACEEARKVDDDPQWQALVKTATGG